MAKRTIRYTEDEFVTLLENIVKRVKKEQRLEESRKRADKRSKLEENFKNLRRNRRK